MIINEIPAVNNITNCFVLFKLPGVPVSQFLKHEVTWILNNVSTRAFVAPDKCDGRSCPYPTKYGYGFQSDIQINPNSPMVAKFIEIKFH